MSNRKGSGNAGAGGGNSDCPFCGKAKPDHEPIACNSRKGCAKCGTPEDHKASACNEPYFPYHSQLCDGCLAPNHEYSECHLKIEAPCRLCGHGGHTPTQLKKGGCPLLKGQKDQVDLPDEITDQFTKSYRQKYLERAVMASKTSSSPKGSPSKSSNTLKISLPDRSTPSKVVSPKGSPGKQALEEDSEEVDPFAAQRKNWRTAELNLAQLPNRTDQKTSISGTSDVKANFFAIQVTPQKAPNQLHKYSITVEYQKTQAAQTSTPEGENADTDLDTTERRKIKRERRRFLIERYFEHNVPSAVHWVTDFDSVVVSVGPLYPKERLGRVISARDLSGNTATSRPSPVELLVSVNSIQDDSHVDFESLKKYVSSKGPITNFNEQLKVLNIISWKNINENNYLGTRVGSKFYPESAAEKQVRKSVEEKELYNIRPGFFSSMRPGDGSILLNVNTVCSAFYSPINLQTWMRSCWNGIHPKSRDFKLKLKGVRVTLKLHSNSRQWNIFDISDKIAHDTKFPDTEPKTRVTDHLNKTYPSYRSTIENRNSFCINVGGANKKTWYPADQLIIVDGQIAKDVMEGKYAKDMVNKAAKRPQQNKNSIMSLGLRDLGLSPLSNHYQAFGVKPVLKNNAMAMVEFQAPRLSAPKLLFADPKPALGIYEGSWNLIDVKSFAGQGTACNNLVVLAFLDYSVEIWIPEQKRAKTVQEFRSDIEQSVTALQTAINKYGLTRPMVKWGHSKPPNLKLRDGFRAKSQKALEDAFQALNMTPESISMMLVILPKRDLRFYAEVKRWADCVQGIPCVCVTQEKLLKLIPSTQRVKGKIEEVKADKALEANICLKINAKLKGTSHNIETSGFAKERLASGVVPSTMIVGADVTHPSKNLEHCPSIAGIVATEYDGSSHYLGSARLQTGRQEYIEDLTGMMCERVKAWFFNKDKQNPNKAQGKERLPKNILFYRDGVSESQYGMVAHEEKSQIFQGCQKALDDLKLDLTNKIERSVTWAPKVTLIVVTKRHHARFYPAAFSYNPGDRKADPNLLAGTMVDKTIIDSHLWNFYLQSHHSALGTAKGAHYVVIFNDEPKYTAGEIQRITNNLCYTGQRATKLLSVCTPAQYADFLCDRLRCYMKPVWEGSYSILIEKDDKEKPVLDENGLPKYVADYKADTHLWKTSAASANGNPWGARLDNFMFYL